MSSPLQAGQGTKPQVPSVSTGVNNLNRQIQANFQGDAGSEFFFPASLEAPVQRGSYNPLAELPNGIYKLLNGTLTKLACLTILA